MNDLLFYTQNSFAPMVLRLMLGLVVFAHGAQKLFGWFGGFGFHGTMDFFTETVGLPWLLAFLIILLESFGAMALIAGAATRLIAGSLLFLAIGIVVSSHIQYGFFMNWFGNQQGEGYEYFLLWIGIAVSLVLTGGGMYSVDRLLISKRQILDQELIL